MGVFMYLDYFNHRITCCKLHNCMMHGCCSESQIHVLNPLSQLSFNLDSSLCPNLAGVRLWRYHNRSFISNTHAWLLLLCMADRLPSPVHPIGMSAQPGSLKTAFCITAYNEKGFIRVLSKCQSGFNDLLSTHTYTEAIYHVCVCVCSHSVCGSFLHCWHFLGNPTFLYFPLCY